MLVLAPGLSACGDDGSSDDAASDETTTSADTTSTTAASSTTLSAEQEVLAAYEAANDAFLAAVDPPNPEHPDLLATRTGASLARTQSNLRGMASQGVGGNVSYESNPTDVAIDGEQATLEDCFVDHTQLYDLATGAPVGEPGTTVLNLDVTMQRVDGVWMLADGIQLEATCEPS
ncbi:MAG: hypothetical protein ACRD0G_11350 [Acidimicrobiales bacterium]